MPIYEYRCAKCEHQFDTIQKFSEAPLTECPSCGQPELRKLVSAPSFQLKGTGWYETDFKTKKKKDGAKSEEGTGATAQSTESGKSESKGESAKSESKGESGKAESGKAESGKGESKSESKSDAKGDAKSGSASASKSPSKPRPAAAD